jgi:hypothetical protein
MVAADADFDAVRYAEAIEVPVATMVNNRKVLDGVIEIFW